MSRKKQVYEKIMAVSLKNRSFAAEIALDTFSMPDFLDLHQQYGLFCKKN